MILVSFDDIANMLIKSKVNGPCGPAHVLQPTWTLEKIYHMCGATRDKTPSSICHPSGVRSEIHHFFVFITITSAYSTSATFKITHQIVIKEDQGHSALFCS